MAFVVNRDQQVYTGGLAPKAAYSRIVSVRLIVSQVAGWQYVVTPVIGNKVWLLGLKVWSEQKAVDNGQLSYFEVYAGGGRDVVIADVINWERILPMVDNANILQHWQIMDGERGYDWQFQRLYVGEQRRFALVGFRVGQDISLLQASFHISEG